VIYSFVESFHNLSKDKKDIIISEIQACERLRKYARDDLDKQVIEAEISDLKMALDLLT
jgi:vacuolar-type H+-ATPase subunit D/Vma8